MDLNKYQIESRKTWLLNYNNDEIRAILGVCGESGELAEKYKKYLREDISYQEYKELVRFELGDILYYISRVADNVNSSLNDIAELNLEKINKRKKENKIKGNGDKR